VTVAENRIALHAARAGDAFHARLGVRVHRLLDRRDHRSHDRLFDRLFHHYARSSVPRLQRAGRQQQCSPTRLHVPRPSAAHHPAQLLPNGSLFNSTLRAL
jgi:hypothetical protein